MVSSLPGARPAYRVVSARAPKLLPSGPPIDLHEWISFEDPTTSDARGSSTHVPAVELDVHLRRRLQGRARRGRHRARTRVAAATAPTSSTTTMSQTVRRSSSPDSSRAIGSSTARATTNGVLETEDGGDQDASRRRVRASSSTSPASPAARVARCTSPLSKPASGHIDWKPDVCWQLPLRLARSTPTTTATSPRTLREWKRRDWGEGGDEFHWWCTESDDAFVGEPPDVPIPARRDHRDGRPGRLRPNGRSCSNARSGPHSPTPPPAANCDEVELRAPERAYAARIPATDRRAG